MNHRHSMKKKNSKTRAGILISILLIITVVFTAVVFAVANIPKDVTILDGSTSLKVTTNQKDPQRIIEENGFRLGKYDVLDASQMNKENAVLIIKREMTVVFGESGGESWRVSLPARTVGDVLAYLNITLEEGDVVEPAEFEIIHSGDRIVLYRAGEATLSADGVSSTIKVSNKTVLQLLAENHIVLGAEDTVKPSLDTVLAKGEEIVVTRVVYKEQTKRVKVSYKTVTEKDTALAEGEEKLVSEGKVGEKEVTYRVRYENGKAVGKEVLDEKVLRQPVDKVIRTGTAKAACNSKKTSGKKTVTVNEEKIKYKKKFTGIASAYYEPAGNLTASGMTVGYGRIGVNPNQIPFGTKLYVTGYGYCVAADCGWGTTGMGRIADLYFPSEADCEAWGLREVTVYVLA